MLDFDLDDNASDASEEDMGGMDERSLEDIENVRMRYALLLSNQREGTFFSNICRRFITRGSASTVDGSLAPIKSCIVKLSALQDQAEEIHFLSSTSVRLGGKYKYTGSVVSMLKETRRHLKELLAFMREEPDDFAEAFGSGSLRFQLQEKLRYVE